MKKKFCIILVSIISVLCLAFGLSACSVKAEFKVSFVVDGQTIHTINTNGNEIITMPPDPQKDDYIFDGWYWDKDVWEKPFTANSLLDAPLSSNMNVYCKWRPEHEHAITEEVIEDKYKASGASCTEKSKYYYSCECGEKGTQTFEYGEFLPHTEETITGKAATCTEAGLTDGKKCAICGNVLVEQATMPVAEHTPSDWIIDKDATCTEKGSKHKECTVCESVITTEEIALVSHTEETITGKVATCTVDGLTDGKKCSVCQTVLVAQETIPAAHTPTAWIIDRNSTCTEKGSRHKECVVCGSTLTTEEIALAPHTETTIYGKVPTCTDSGLTNGRMCSVCGQTIAAQTVIPANGHKYDNGICLSCGAEQAPATISEVKGGTINDFDIYMFVEHDVTEVNLLRIVTCSPKSTWKLYEDKRGQHEIATKIASGENDELNNGNNVFYIVATSANGIDVNTYTLTIYRSFEVSIDYYNADTVLKTEKAFTGHEFSTDYTPEIVGYIFNEWKNDGETFINTVLWDNLNLQADKTARTYQVTFITDEKAEAVNAITATYDQEITLPASSKTGYTFNGWLDGNEISENTFVWNFIEDKQYSAKFTANEYTITYIPNGGTLASTTQTVTFDSEYTLYEISRTGYTFTGWYNGDERIANGAWQRPVDCTFTAQWQANSYTVTFDANGGTCETTTSEYVYDGNYSLPDISRVGYTLTGWYYGEQKIIAAVWIIAVDCTLTAHWKANTDTLYMVKHIGQNINDDEFGVDLLTEEQHGTSDSKVTPSVKSYTGFTSPQAKEIAIAPDGSTILIYHYTRNSYTLTLCANNGTKNTTQAVKYEAEIVLPAERQGYTFGGWFANTALTQSALSMPARNLTVYAWWQEENKANDFTYTTQGTITISGYTGASTSVVIPTYIGGVAVTELAANAFKDKSTLTQVVVPNSVTSIAENAFYGCSGLTSITLPFVGESIKTLSSTYQYPLGYIFGTGSYTGGTATAQYYYGSSTSARSSTTYYIPSSLKSVMITGGNIPYGAFYHCSSLTSITIGNNVAGIGDYAFYDCSNLTSITIPDSVTSIGEGALCGCSGLTSITLPYAGESRKTTYRYEYPLGYIFGTGSYTGGTATAQYYYVEGSSSNSSTTYYIPSLLKSVTITGGNILHGAFSGCSGLTSITIGNKVASIGSSAFSGCNGLTSITIPDSVKSIGSYAFSGCSNLTSITIPDSVTSIAENAFYGCSGLTSITVASGNSKYHSNDNCLIETAAKTLVLGCKNSVIPTDGSVTSIDSFAFSGCSNLTSITIPDGVTSIGSYAFYGCSNLTSITIPDSVTSIGSYAFYGCNSLVSVEFVYTTNGFWQICKKSDFSSDVDRIFDSALADPATAAQYLRLYNSYYWRRIRL